MGDQSIKLEKFRSVSSTELQQNVGHYLLEAMRSPVIVKKHGRATNVVMSVHTFEALASGRAVLKASDLDEPVLDQITTAPVYEDNAEHDHLLDD